ncbi:Cytochrome bc complex cytochrome b subunit [Polystyrenella longa]|uniref:Cytochrome bc complex cytochrome b subunit n=1 Tax=Polystyrenella longa TaxID=2528007 RepID=A0A518CMX2_9PLAN|nr:cytochrome b N-terminal domain-containing protein [Polystyrenella longa]QDU80570.1 Cytochrome bc complex cytochrome b subunit [Polystyrenella longa]
MWTHFRTWLDDRTGYQKMLGLYSRRVLPNGPSWMATTASCVLWMFVIELITGLVLLSSFSPSASSAWASVFYIEQLPAGSFLRGLHYFSAQALIILFGLHTMRVLLTAAFREPRELVWITGLLLVPLLMVWAVTGNPLPATQKGYSQIEVEANILGGSPGVGPVARAILIGGDDVGNITLTHLNFLHMAMLPLIVGVLTIFHIWQLFKHSPSDKELPPEMIEGAARYWPEQTVRNWVVFSIAFGIVAYLAYTVGAPLEVPADPSIHHIARPEWYFLFLFELRRYFPPELDFIATMVIPTVGLLFMLFLPFIDRFCSQRAGTILRYVIIIGFVVSWTGLTITSMNRDRNDEALQASRQEEEHLRERVHELALGGIPPEGASALLQNDPKTQGPILFKAHCANCHSHVDENGEGFIAENQTAPNLYKFGSREWVTKVLDPEQWASDHMFGNTELSESDMASGVVDFLPDVDEDLPKLIAALSAEAELPYQIDQDTEDTEQIAEGIEFLKDEEGCASCHKVYDSGENGYGPDLTWYGSKSWMRDFISNPEHSRFYGMDNNYMPAFAPNPNHPTRNELDEHSIQMLVDWLRQDWYEAPETAE